MLLTLTQPSGKRLIIWIATISTACVKTAGALYYFLRFVGVNFEKGKKEMRQEEVGGASEWRQSYQNIFSFLSIPFPSHNLPSLVGQNGGWHSFADLNSRCAKIPLHCSLGCHRHLPKLVSIFKGWSARCNLGSASFQQTFKSRLTWLVNAQKNEPATECATSTHLWAVERALLQKAKVTKFQLNTSSSE